MKSNSLHTKLCLALALLCQQTQAEDWPQWRGPGGQGHSNSKQLPTQWSETNNIKWRVPIPGRAWSSPVIEGDRIWLTTAIETPAKPEDAARRIKGNTGNQPLTLLESVSLRAVGLDKQTGRIVHNIELLQPREPQWVHELNSFASPTPVIENGLLYSHFGTFGTACLDTRTGSVLWRNTELQIMHENGPGSTPVLWNDKLIFHCDGSDVQYIAALDKKTGKLAWKTPRTGAMNDNPQLRKAYGTPLIIPVNGKAQVLSPAADWIYSYDPTNGRELWKLNYGVLGFSIVPKPVAGHGMLYLSTSFMRAEILALKLDGNNPPSIAWRHPRSAPQMPSPILVGDELYTVSDSGGVVTCLDAHKGTMHWQERIGGNYSASPTYGDGKIYFHSREGITTVLRPGLKFEVLAKNPLDGRHMASLAAADGALFLRTDKALYRIEQR